MIPSTTFNALRNVSKATMDCLVSILVQTRTPTPIGGSTTAWGVKPNTVPVPCRLDLPGSGTPTEQVTADQLSVAPKLMLVTDVAISVLPTERVHVTGPGIDLVLSVISADLPRSLRVSHKYLCEPV